VAGGGMTTVLIVDDEALAAEETAEALELAGLSTQWSADPFDALARAADSAIGLVVTDLRMPGLDGFISSTECGRRAPICAS